MLCILIFKRYDDEENTVTSLLTCYGREYSATRDRRGVTIFRTNGSSYERLPKWKQKADTKKITEFMNNV